MSGYCDGTNHEILELSVKRNGYHSYNTENYGTLSANFEATTYDWSNMPNALSGSNNAIATLMFHCGVGVEMQYGVAETGGSGGYVIEAQSPIHIAANMHLKPILDIKIPFRVFSGMIIMTQHGYRC